MRIGDKDIAQVTNWEIVSALPVQRWTVPVRIVNGCYEIDMPTMTVTNLQSLTWHIHDGVADIELS